MEVRKACSYRGYSPKRSHLSSMQQPIYTKSPTCDYFSLIGYDSIIVIGGLHGNHPVSDQSSLVKCIACERSI